MPNARAQRLRDKMSRQNVKTECQDIPKYHFFGANNIIHHLDNNNNIRLEHISKSLQAKEKT